MCPRSLELRGLQRWFQGEILAPGRRSRAKELVRPSRTLAPEERVAIYQRMYFARLRECLAADFPAVERVLGAAAFTRLARGYLARFPSTHYSLNALGRNLPGWLEGRVPVPRRALVRDLARLEWAMSEVFDAPEAAPLSEETVARIPADAWARTRLRPIPAFRLLALGYPANAIVTAARQEKRLPALRRRATFVATFRKNYVVWRMDLTKPAYRILAALAAGKTLGAAIGEAGPGVRPADVRRWFRTWVSEGIFEEARVP